MKMIDMAGDKPLTLWLKRWKKRYDPATKSKRMRTNTRSRRPITKTVVSKGPIGCLVTGSSGTGKTTLVMTALKRVGFQHYRYSCASDRRDEQTVKQLLGTPSFGNEPLVVVFDELEGMGASDRGGIAEIARNMRDGKHHVAIICICRSIGDNRKLQPLKRAFSVKIKLKPQRPNAIACWLAQQCDNVSMETVEKIAFECGGDLRQAKYLLHQQHLVNAPTSTCDKYIHTVQQATDSVCLLYTSPSPRDGLLSRMPSSA